MTVKIDLKRSTRLRQTRDGYRQERIAIVSGVTGTAEQRLYNAINAVGLPQIGDAHPEISDVTLNDKTVEPLGGGQYQVTLSYYKDSGVVTDRANAESSVRTSLAIDEEHRDINGQPMITRYKDAASGTRKEERFIATVERPRHTIDFEYTASEYPAADIDLYQGKINNDTWNGYPPGTVICSGIDVDQAGANFRVRYSFSVQPNGWVFTATASVEPGNLEAHPTNPDSLLDLETGERIYPTYSPVDFGPLGFVLGNVNYSEKFLAGVSPTFGYEATFTQA